MKSREIKIGPQRLRAEVEPGSFNEEKLTVDVVWYTGAPIIRSSFFDGPYMLQFDMDPKAVRMGRLKSGKAPLKRGHASMDDPDAVIGVIESATLGKDGGRATVRFSPRDDVAPLISDIRSGILGNLSMEAIPYQMKEITKKGDAIPTLLAIDWEPMAVALVGVGADPGARMLSSSEEFPCTITLSAEAVASAQTEAMMKVRLLSTNEITEIKDEEFDEELHSQDLAVPRKADPAVADDKSEDRKLADLKDADTKRSARIRELMLHFELDEIWAQRHIKLGSSVDVAAADGRKRVAEKAPDIDGRLTMGADFGSIGWKSDRIVEALSARALGQVCPEPALQWARSTIAECAFALLEQRGETRGRALDPLRAPYDVIKLGMGTTDFPGLLANVLNKTLMPAYQIAPASYRQIAAQRQFRDYRPHKFVRLGDFPLTLQVGEGGEITEGAVGEGSETVTALKYGRILNITWETLVNDDLNALNDFGGMVARRIADRENALFYATCIAAAAGLGPSLADGVAVHNAAHGNVGAAGALSNTTLGEAWALMTAQTTIDGLKTNTPPRYLLTSSTSHILARSFLSPVFAAQASNVNSFVGVLEAIYDSNLSGTRFYTIADPARLPNYIYGMVGGNGPRFEVRQGWEIEGVQIKAVHDFGCGAIDFRGTTTHAGA